MYITNKYTMFMNVQASIDKKDVINNEKSSSKQNHNKIL